MPTQQTGDECYQQPDDSLQITQAQTVRTERFHGMRDAIESKKNEYEVGQRDVSSIQMDGGNGGTATLTVTYTDPSETDESRTADTLSTTWAMSTSQITYPIEKYCGPSEGASALAWQLRAWRQERDNVLYQSFQFRDSTGDIITLSGNTQKLAEKIMKGVESVMRFYPTVQKVSRLGSGKIDGLGEGLAEIDSPGGPYSGAAKEWLKIGDNVQQNEDGTQTRTESWLGADEIDSDLYGSSGERWEFGTI